MSCMVTELMLVEAILRRKFSHLRKYLFALKRPVKRLWQRARSKLSSRGPSSFSPHDSIPTYYIYLSSRKTAIVDCQGMAVHDLRHTERGLNPPFSNGMLHWTVNEIGIISQRRLDRQIEKRPRNNILYQLLVFFRRLRESHGGVSVRPTRLTGFGL